MKLKTSFIDLSRLTLKVNFVHRKAFFVTHEPIALILLISKTFEWKITRKRLVKSYHRFMIAIVLVIG